MKIKSKNTVLAFTLVEMVTSIGCGTIILAAITTAGVALQRSYAAVEAYSIAEADQLRVVDYIAMDCRRAIKADVNPVTVNGVTQNALVLTLRPFYSSTASSAVPNAPSLASGNLSYGTDIVTVTYQQNGTTFTREVKVTDSTGATVRSDITTPIARKVATFTTNPVDLTKTVSCSIMFFPNFLRNAGSGTWRSGGSTPDGIGANGDWYVRDTTAPSANVGDVYFKSNGSYSQLQNVKATTVASNTFLRNADARQ